MFLGVDKACWDNYNRWTMRYYIVQYCHAMRGWTDLPQTATKKAKEAEKVSEEVAKERRMVTRVIRKPNGWEPSEG